MDIAPKQNISKETQVLHDTLDEMDLIDIFRTIHANAEEYTFSRAPETFSKIDHILGHKSNLNFSDHDAMRLDINYKKKLQETQTHGD